MSDEQFYIKRNDTSPSIQRTLLDASGTAITLSGATVRFHMRSRADGSTKTDEAATIVDAGNGIVKYDWVAGDTDTAGTYDAEFEVTYADTTIETFPNSGFIDIIVMEDVA